METDCMEALESVSVIPVAKVARGYGKMTSRV
jgi:hypothetical protein